MKANIHPKIHPVVFIDTSTDAEFITTSTLTSEQKKKINGVDHYVIKVEISSSSHPFYTGKRKLVDTAGRVDKFLARAKRAQEIQEKKVKIVDNELDEILHQEEEVKQEEKTEAALAEAVQPAETPAKEEKKKSPKAVKKAPAKASTKKAAPKKTTTKKTATAAKRTK